MSHKRSSLLRKLFFSSPSVNRFRSSLNLIFMFFQGEGCNTHDDFAGVCIELPQCSTLINLYRSNPSKQTVDILVSNQRNCGNRKVGRNPLMCCSDGVPQTTRPPPTSSPSGSPCSTPDSISGYCIGMCHGQSRKNSELKFRDRFRRETMSISADNIHSTPKGS